LPKLQKHPDPLQDLDVLLSSLEGYFTSGKSRKSMPWEANMQEREVRMLENPEDSTLVRNYLIELICIIKDFDVALHEAIEVFDEKIRNGENAKLEIIVNERSHFVTFPEMVKIVMTLHFNIPKIQLRVLNVNTLKQEDELAVKEAINKYMLAIKDLSVPFELPPARMMKWLEL
jgi:hypothetical protein